MHRVDLSPILVRQRNDIGDVIFALRIVVGELRQPALQIAAVGDQDAGIDFGDLQLIGRGVFLLDNADDGAVFAYDAPVAAGIVQHHRQQADAAFRFGVAQTLQRLLRDQRHVAVKHQDIFVVSECGGGLLHCVAGAELFRLQHPVERRLGQRGLQPVAAVTIHQMNMARAEAGCGVDHVLNHGFACKGMQNFGQIGIHTGSLAGSKDHHAHCAVRHNHPDRVFDMRKLNGLPLRLLHFSQVEIRRARVEARAKKMPARRAGIS